MTLAVPPHGYDCNGRDTARDPPLVIIVVPALNSFVVVNGLPLVGRFTPPTTHRKIDARCPFWMSPDTTATAVLNRTVPCAAAAGANGQEQVNAGAVVHNSGAGQVQSESD